MWRRPYRSIDFGEREWTYPLKEQRRRRTTATATTAKQAERFRSLRKNNTYKSGFEKASQSDYASFSRLGFLDFALFGLHAMSSVEELLDLGRMHAKKRRPGEPFKVYADRLRWVLCQDFNSRCIYMCKWRLSSAWLHCVERKTEICSESCCRNACNWSAAKCHSKIRCKKKGSCWQYCCTIRIVGYKLDEIFWWRPCACHCLIVWQGNWKWRWWTSKGYVNSPPQSFSDREQKELELAISESHRTKAEHDSRTARSSSAGFHLFISSDVCMPQAFTGDVFLHWTMAMAMPVFWRALRCDSIGDIFRQGINLWKHYEMIPVVAFLSPRNNFPRVFLNSFILMK